MIPTATRDLHDEPVIEGLVTDLTKFKTTEKTARQAVDELQNAQEYSQLLINSSFDIIIACDVQQRITQFNPAAEQAFGYTREEALGQQISILYSDPDSSVAILKTILRGVAQSLRRKIGVKTVTCSPVFCPRPCYGMSKVNILGSWAFPVISLNRNRQRKR